MRPASIKPNARAVSPGHQTVRVKRRLRAGHAATSKTVTGIETACHKHRDAINKTPPPATTSVGLSSNGRSGRSLRGDHPANPSSDDSQSDLKFRILHVH